VQATLAWERLFMRANDSARGSNDGHKEASPTLSK